MWTREAVDGACSAVHCAGELEAEKQEQGGNSELEELVTCPAKP